MSTHQFLVLNFFGSKTALVKSKILVRTASNLIETLKQWVINCINSMLSLASSKSSNEIDTVSVDDVEKIVSEIASEDENWCPPEVNLKTYS